ncbi:hypothetical protein BSZ21_06080 [Bradyrhizobium canariense]|nr:hypothetical protein BSZ21_06080 [Bradyrhizobium canariense]
MVLTAVIGGVLRSVMAPSTRSRSAASRAGTGVGDVGATIAGLEHGMGFLPWVRDGRIHKLEGFPYERARLASISSE